MTQSPCVKWAVTAVLLLALLAGDSLLQVSAAPQAVLMGRRPAVQPEPIIIDNEEAMGKPMDQVVDPLAPEPDIDPMIGFRGADVGAAGESETTTILVPVTVTDAAGELVKVDVEVQYQSIKQHEDAIKKLEEDLEGMDPGTERTDKEAKLEAVKKSLAVFKLKNPAGSGDQSTKGPDEKEGMAIWIIVMIVVLVLILVAVLIWAIVRHRKKKALRAQGLNAEVTSVTPVITPDGRQANVVHMEPLSAPTTGTPTAGA